MAPKGIGQLTLTTHWGCSLQKFITENYDQIMSSSSTQPTPGSFFSPQLLEMIRCPVTHSNLKVASTDLLEDLNQQIANGKIVDRIGQTIQGALESALVNQDDSLLLPIRGGIVILIADQAISLGQLRQ